MAKFVHIRMASGRTHESALLNAEEKSLEEVQSEFLLQLSAAKADSNVLPVIDIPGKILFLDFVESIEFTEDDTIGAIPAEASFTPRED